MRESRYRITKQQYLEVLDDPESFQAAKYYIQNTSCSSKTGKAETLVSLDYHVDNGAVSSGPTRRLKAWSTRNRERLLSSSFNSNECLDSSGSESAVQGAQVTKLRVHCGQVGPVSELIELCRQSPRNHIASFSSGNVSQLVLRMFDNL